MIVKDNVLIHPGAQIGENVRIEPFVVIAEDVIIGDNAWIGPHVTILNGVRMGNNCKVFPGAVIGGIPQDIKYSGEESIVQIGNNVTIREYCTLNRGTRANYKTHIQDNCLLMAYVHVAHDCIIGRNSILANNVNLAGHIEIGEYVTLGGLTAVHQFVKVGEHAFIGGGSLVRKDIPSYVKAAREPISYAGINSIGLRRRGFTEEQINDIQNVYRVLFVKGYNTRQALKIIETTMPPTKERDKIVQFIVSADRGIIKGFKKLNG